MRKRGRYEAVRPKKKGRKVLAILICLLLLLLIGIGVAGVVIYNDFLNRIEYVEEVENTGPLSDDILAMMGTEPPTVVTEPAEVETTAATEATAVPTEITEPTEPKIPEIINVMLIGQSYRKGEENYLSDTLILVSVNKDSKEVTLTSFPRDTWVDLPDYKHHTCGWNLINTNYALGYNFGGTAAAMTMINECLRINFGIEVDYDIEISLEAFPAIIDALGGVRLELTQAEADYINDLGYEWVQPVTAGENRLFGDAALEYARMRKAEGDSDSDSVRTERQRKLLTALFEKVRTKSFKSLQKAAYEILPLIKTNMTNEEITGFLFDLVPMLAEMTISSGTCPVSGTAWPEDRDVPGVGWRSVMVFASEQQKRLMMPITEGYAP